MEGLKDPLRPTNNYGKEAKKNLETESLRIFVNAINSQLIGRTSLFTVLYSSSMISRYCKEKRTKPHNCSGFEYTVLFFVLTTALFLLNRKNITALVTLAH